MTSIYIVLAELLLLAFLVILAKKLFHLLVIPKRVLHELDNEQSGINIAHGMRGNQEGKVYADKRINTEAIRGL